MTLIYNILILRPLSLHILTTSYIMKFLDLNDDVKSSITKHITSDCKINKIFMTKSDNDLQKKLSGGVKEMKIDIDDICLFFKKK